MGAGLGAAGAAKRQQRRVRCKRAPSWQKPRLSQTRGRGGIDPPGSGDRTVLVNAGRRLHVAPWYKARPSAQRSPVPAWCLMRALIREAAGLRLIWLALVRWARQGPQTAATNTLCPCRRRCALCSLAQAKPSGPRNSTRLCPVQPVDGPCAHPENRLQVSVGCPFHLGDPRFEARQGPNHGWPPNGMEALSISCSTAR